MKALLLLMTLCAPQSTGAQTQPSLLEQFRSQVSVADRTRTILDWCYRRGDTEVETLVSTEPINGISQADRLTVIKRFASDLKLRRELLEKEGLYAAARAADQVTTVEFNDVKAIVEKEGYDKWVKEYISYLDTGLFARYIKATDDKRPQKIVAVTFGSHDPGYLIRLYFFFRLTKDDWAWDFVIPQIEVPRS